MLKVSINVIACFNHTIYLQCIVISNKGKSYVTTGYHMGHTIEFVTFIISCCSIPWMWNEILVKKFVQENVGLHVLEFITRVNKFDCKI